MLDVPAADIKEENPSPQKPYLLKKSLFILGSIAGLLILLIAVNQQFNIFSHAGISLFTTCIPIPSGMLPERALSLSQRGKIHWCNQLHILGQTNLNKIAKENNLSGTKDWEITKPTRTTIESDEEKPQGKVTVLGATASPYIEGYAQKQSYQTGETVDVFVHSSDSSFTADVYRLGWYNGQGSRYIATYTSSITNTNAPTLTPSLTTGYLSESGNWQQSLRFPIPSSWVTGWYLIKLTAKTSGMQSYIPFILKDPVGTGDILYVHADNTDQAYNTYGGVSLYWNYNNSLPTGHGDYVSFNRPYVQNNGAGASLSWEYPLIRFLESKGYDIDYVSDSDVEENPSILLNHKAIITAGHTEYWSKNMRDGVDTAIANGKDFANFAANELYWHIRYQDNLRTIVCYKDPQSDGTYVDPLHATDPSQDTSLWRLAATANRPEQSTTGSMYSSYFSPSNITFPWVATNTANWPSWLIAGTGITDGTSIRGIVGYEYDKIWQNYPMPSGDTMLSNSPVSNVYANPKGSINDFSNSTIYQAPGSAWVFNASTIDWSWGLDNWTAPFTSYPKRAATANVSLQRMTTNLLDHFIGSSVPTPTPVATYYQDVLNSKPIAYYRLSDTYTNTAKTAVGLINGKYINAPKQSQAGALVPAGDLNPSVFFNGSNQYISLPYVPSLNSHQFSVEAWVYPTTENTSRYWGIASSRNYPKGWTLYVNNNNTSDPYVTFWVNNGNSMMATGNVGAEVQVKISAWNYVVATFDGITEKLYVDGKFVASSTVVSYVPNTTNAETIGQGQPGTGFYFPGKIDEVAWYNYPLSLSAIQTHYTAAGYSL